MSTSGPAYAPPERILLVTDLKDLRHTLPFTKQYALVTGAQIKIMHVLSGVLAPSDPPQLQKKNLAETEMQASAILERAARSMRRAGILCEMDVQREDLFRELQYSVEEWAPDCIVLSLPHSYSPDRVEFDAPKEWILCDADVPVYVVRESSLRKRRMPDAGRKLNILFATTLDRETHAITEYVVRFAGFRQGDLTMLHVISSTAASRPWKERVRRYAEQHFRQILSSFRPSASFMVQEGPVVETICKVVEEGKFDLLLIGSVSGASFRKDIMPGSAYRLACSAPCPVLILKKPEEPTYETMPASLQPNDFEFSIPLHRF